MFFSCIVALLKTEFHPSIARNRISGLFFFWSSCCISYICTDVIFSMFYSRHSFFSSSLISTFLCPNHIFILVSLLLCSKQIPPLLYTKQKYRLVPLLIELLYFFYMFYWSRFFIVLFKLLYLLFLFINNI